MSYHYKGKLIKVKSDYDPDTYMKFHGKKLCAIIDAVKALMDAISMEEDA